MKPTIQKNGFTLIEILVVLVLFSSVGSIIASILFTTLRGNSKATVLINVKQNGNYAISQIEKTVRDAQTFKGVSLDTTIAPVDTSFNLNCSTPLPQPEDPPTPPNVPTPTPIRYKHVRVADSNSVVYTFSCVAPAGSPATVRMNVNPPGTTSSLLDTASVSMQGSTCYFTCIQQNRTDSPIIGIHFELTHYIAPTPGAVLVENQVEKVSFDATASIRNLNK